jgi:uncharacterized membrane protein YphA (DoxX/SURF4 family)/predicted DCC family thiol-disulfide oxidoreductase YuxK
MGVLVLAKGLELPGTLQGRPLEWATFELPPKLGPVIAGLWLVAGLALLVGYVSRVAAMTIAGLTAVLILFGHVYSNHVYLLGTLALLLSLSDCGAYASMGSMTGIRDRVPRLPVTLIQIQISLVYLFSGLSKINEDFVPGNTLFYHAREAFVAPDVDPVAYVPLFMGMAIGTIVLELFIAVGLWFDRTRPAVFGTGLALHAGMVLILSQGARGFFRLTLFAGLALSCYLLFVKAPLRGRVIVWDESSSFSSTWVRWFKRLDWLGAFRFVAASDMEPADTPQLFDLDGHRYGGFEAVRRILQVLPLTFLWAPYLGLRPVTAVGRSAYRTVAARRTYRVALPGSTSVAPRS